jgi:hypothetical protein
MKKMLYVSYIAAVFVLLSASTCAKLRPVEEQARIDAESPLAATATGNALPDKVCEGEQKIYVAVQPTVVSSPIGSVTAPIGSVNTPIAVEQPPLAILPPKGTASTTAEPATVGGGRIQPPSAISLLFAPLRRDQSEPILLQFAKAPECAITFNEKIKNTYLKVNAEEKNIVLLLEHITPVQGYCFIDADLNDANVLSFVAAPAIISAGVNYIMSYPNAPADFVAIGQAISKDPGNTAGVGLKN